MMMTTTMMMVIVIMRLYILKKSVLWAPATIPVRRVQSIGKARLPQPRVRNFNFKERARMDLRVRLRESIQGTVERGYEQRAHRLPT
eukprot:COSAG05_NODE_1766_length_4119_cov_3.978856_4_plen_87_part_00